jgi:hypothetical protein
MPNPKPENQNFKSPKGKPDQTENTQKGQNDPYPQNIIPERAKYEAHLKLPSLAQSYRRESPGQI